MWATTMTFMPGPPRPILTAPIWKIGLLALGRLYADREWRVDDARKSQLVVVLGTNGKTNMFRCPLDRDDTYRNNPAYQQANDGPYNYSYEFTSFNVTDTGASPGFTTIIDKNTGKVYPFKTTMVRNAANKLLVAEPTAALTPNEEPPVEAQWGKRG